MISLDNTQTAFAYKSDAALRKANFLFSLIAKPFVVKATLAIVPVAIRWGLPFTNSLIKKTIFPQFVGGETMEETIAVSSKLGNYNVKVILDYGVEGGDASEASFDDAAQQFIKVVNYASRQTNVPFISIKVTGIARFGLLEKLNTLIETNAGVLLERYHLALQQLSQNEKTEWNNLIKRLEDICNVAAEKKIAVLIDAEETWIQSPVDALVMQLMLRYNSNSAVIFNTLQLYRHDRLQFLKDCHEIAMQGNIILGVKLVRGAYMEKERERAIAMNYPSPIQPDKASCDSDFNAAATYCIDHVNTIHVIVASHNEESNILAASLLLKRGLPPDHKHVHFSQLYGMSDNITFNLAQQGFSASKYLPFGPIKDVIPYLMRRAQENTSVSGQTGRELSLLRAELKRRLSKPK